MLEVFYESKNIVYREFIPQGHTVNKTMYRDIPRCLWDAIRWKHLELRWAGKWVLHHNNAPAHQSPLVNEYLAQDITVLLQLPHSSDLVPANHYPFSQLRELLKGWWLLVLMTLRQPLTAGLIRVTKNGLQDCFQRWYYHWQRCVMAKVR
jgi:hypothetical protein